MIIKYIYDIAKENNLNEDTVEKIIRSQFEMVKIVMETGEFKSIRLQGLGTFKVKPGRLYCLNKWKGTKYDKNKKQDLNKE